MTIHSEVVQNKLNWYFGPRIEVTSHSRVFASQDVGWFRVYVIGSSHQVDFGSKDGPRSEIFTHQPLPVIAEEIILGSDLNRLSPTSRIWTEVYDERVAIEFGQINNRLSFSFGDGSWTVISWEVLKGSIAFKTLHTYREINLNVWTKSEYVATNI